jgi:hypothetical protein
MSAADVVREVLAECEARRRTLPPPPPRHDPTCTACGLPCEKVTGYEPEDRLPSDPDCRFWGINFVGFDYEASDCCGAETEDKIVSIDVEDVVSDVLEIVEHLTTVASGARSDMHKARCLYESPETLSEIQEQALARRMERASEQAQRVDFLVGALAAYVQKVNTALNEPDPDPDDSGPLRVPAAEHLGHGEARAA